MSKISEKVAYLDGLMEGLDIQDAKLKKLFSAIIDTLDDIAEELSDHEDELDELNENMDEVYDCIDEYDDVLYGDEDEDYDEDEDEDDEFYEVVCPSCGETVCFDADMLDNPKGLLCPNCNELIDIVIDSDETDED